MLGNKIKKLRENNNMSQLQLAEKLCVSRTAISNYEKNIRMPSIDTLKKLSLIFNVDINELVDTNSNEISVKKSEHKYSFLVSVIIPIIAILNSSLLPYILLKIDPTGGMAYGLIIGPISYIICGMILAFLTKKILQVIVSLLIAIIPAFLVFEYAFNMQSFPSLIIYFIISLLSYLLIYYLKKIIHKAS